MTTATDDVELDYEGALALARQLYDLSTWLDRVRLERTGAADGAQTAWRGPYGNDFRLAAAGDDHEADRLAAALHAEALDWARAWADAVNEQNRRRRDRRIAEIAAGRSLLDRAVDLVTFDHPDEHVAALTLVDPPRSPDFIPPGGLQHF